MSNESYGIRHGESEANVGGTAKDPHSTNLTPKGEAQSERVANEIKYLGIQSALIISSPFLRAKQTALPTRRLFPNIPYEEWEVYEFSYLGGLHGKDLNNESRRKERDEFWKLSNPTFVHGGDPMKSESFAAFIERVSQVREKIHSTKGVIFIFSHEQFLNALFWLEEKNPKNITHETMKDYKTYITQNRLPNGSLFSFNVYSGTRRKKLFAPN